MAGQKQIGWNKLVLAVVFTAIFLVSSLIGFVPQTADAAASYNWTDTSTIHATGFTTGFQTQPTQEFDFACTGTFGSLTCTASTQTGQCLDTITVGNDTSTGTLAYYTGYEDGAAACPPTPQKTVKITIGNTTAGPTAAPATQTGQTDDTTDPNLDCHVSVNPLTWFICPFIKGMDSIVNELDSIINGLLTVDQNKIFNTDTASGKGYYSAWQTFRDFGLAILVIAGLFMVISQALGFEILDAYTIKKVVPRLAIAVIGISLSWELMQFFVVLTNDLGNGIRQIIYYPFRDLTAHTQLSLGGGGDVAVTLIGGGAIAAFGLIGLASFALTGFLAVMVAFLVLILRQLVILLLILVAPLAIACSVLPNTQSVYKLWWESFSKAMMMFPIIVGFLAIGRVFAVTSIGDNIGSASAVSQLIGFAAYFLPYFLIPKTFSLAGGALRTIGGSVNDRSRGGFDRLKKFRQGKVAQNMQAMRSGNRMKGDSWVADKFNKTTSGVAALPNAELGMDPRKWNSRLKGYQSNHGMAAAQEFLEKGHAIQAIKGNDDFLTAGIMSHGNEKEMASILQSRGYSESAIAQAIPQIRAARRETSNEVFETAAAMALPATGTAFKGGAGEMHNFINEVSEGDSVKAARMLVAMRSGAGQARRFDLAGGGFGHQAEIMTKQGEDIEAVRNDRTIDNAEKARRLSVIQQEASTTIARDSLEGQGGSYIVGARKGAVQNFAPVAMQVFDEKVANGDNTEIDRELAVMAGRYDGMAQVAPENARIWASGVMGQTRTINGVTATIQQHIEDRRTPNTPTYSDRFVEMRREYGSNAARNGALAQQAALQSGLGPQGPVIPPPLPPVG